MSKRISDAQIYGLIWATETTYGTISELHNPPPFVYVPGDRKRQIELYRTAFDRAGLLGLARRGFLRLRISGIWEITDAGRAELSRPAIARRIAELADETAARQAAKGYDD